MFIRQPVALFSIKREAMKLPECSHQRRWSSTPGQVPRRLWELLKCQSGNRNDCGEFHCVCSLACLLAHSSRQRLSHGVLGGDWNWGAADAAGQLLRLAHQNLQYLPASSRLGLSLSKKTWPSSTSFISNPSTIPWRERTMHLRIETSCEVKNLLLLSTLPLLSAHSSQASFAARIDGYLPQLSTAFVGKGEPRLQLQQ